MNTFNLSCYSIVFFTANILCANVLFIEDFDRYPDTASLQTNVFTFGTGAQSGKPELVPGAGTDGSNAAYLMLTWEHGNNANLGLINLNSAGSKLAAGSSIQASIYIETASGYSAATNPTLVKLAIEGTNGTIWQTKTQFAVRPTLGSFYKLAINVSADEMERVSAADGSFEETIASIQSIRFRFENSVQAGVFENAYIDSVVSVSEHVDEPSTGTIIELGMIHIPSF